MKKTTLGALSLVVPLFILTGCGNFTAPTRWQYQGHVPVMNTTAEHKFDKDSFKVLGPVTARSSGITLLFGLIINGDNGYENLFQEAKTKYPDVDTIIDLREDTHIVAFLGSLYLKEERIITGTAIRYVR